jgi:hypothetical protein
MTVIANQDSAAIEIGYRVDSGLGPNNPTIGKDRRVDLPRDAVESTVSTLNNKPKNRNPRPADNPKSDKVERVIVGIVLFVLAAVPLLTFLFSFGNVGDLGTSLGIDQRIAYLTGPAVDLTATGMIVAATWLSYRGMSERELWRVHALSIICALIMFALNCGPSIYAHRYQLAGFSAVGPFLLMAMGFVGPWLLRQLTDTRTAPARATKPVPARHETAAPAERTAPGTAQPPAERTAPEPARAPGTAHSVPPAAVPAPTQPAPERAKPDAGTTKPAGTGTRVPFEVWLDRAVPLFESYAEKHGEHPTAAVLAAHLRNAFPDPDMPGSDRWERKLNSAVKKHLGFDEETEAAGVVTQ